MSRSTATIRRLLALRRKGRAAPASPPQELTENLRRLVAAARGVC
jgi:hypothetical protein